MEVDGRRAALGALFDSMTFASASDGDGGRHIKGRDLDPPASA